MSSIIPGFEYDIFISYRQKDNKYDGWVTEFVDNLKRELEATFKEEIDVYFDINPHDGLLETHNVDASLKEKLRCLVFIPIISQTYCDSKSFAWQYEFCAFNALVKEDLFGRDIRLAGGNVTSRILPVKIHDIEPEDETLLENELGSTLRCIEFIYKSPGVNRPLRANEDHPRDNLNKTYYRDQINKVANSVKEIINALKKHNLPDGIIEKKQVKKKLKPPVNLRNSILPATFIIVLLAVLGFFIIMDFVKSAAPEDKSVAVLPFDNLSSDADKKLFSDAIADILTSQLSHNPGLRVIGRTSTLKYKTVKKTISEIGAELSVNYVIEGTFQVQENRMRLSVQLIRVFHEGHLWSKIYDRELTEIFEVQNDISEQIAEELKAVLTPDEKERVARKSTKNPDAYLNYISGNVYSENSWYFLLTGNKFVDSTSFESAIEMYDKAIMYDREFALAYARRAIARSWGYFTGYFDDSEIEKCKRDIDKALEIDEDLNEARIALGFYYYYCFSDYEKALMYFKKAAEKEPWRSQCLYYMAIVYRRTGEWGKSQDLMRKVLRSDPQDALILTNIGLSYYYLHKYDSAIYYQDKAADIMPNWSAPYYNKFTALLLKNGNTSEVRLLLDSVSKKTGKSYHGERIMLDIYDGKFREALDKIETSEPDDFYNQGDKYMYLATIYGYLDDQPDYEKYLDSAKIFFDKELIGDPDNPYLNSSLGIVYADLGDKRKAVDAGKRGIELARNDKLNETDRMVDLAAIYTTIGDYDNSIRDIEYLLDNPSGLSIKILQLDPVWKPLVARPDFKELIRRFSID